MRYSQRWPEYAHLWDTMTINQDREHEFQQLAEFAYDHKAVYQDIEASSDVPWPMTAVIHRRESNANFSRYLGNGQRLNQVTTIAPRGRGPFTGPNAFKDGALDAFKVDGLSSVPDWRLEKILYYLELYNGFGYANRGLPSPYLWGGTNIQKPGKYGTYVNGHFVDNAFDPHIMDSQPGCAPLLSMITKVDPSVQFIRES